MKLRFGSDLEECLLDRAARPGRSTTVTSAASCWNSRLISRTDFGWLPENSSVCRYSGVA